MIAAALLAAAPLTCGAVPRPGVAALDQNGQWHGAAVDACRRASARLGRPAIRFRGYRDREALHRSAADDIAFLSADERAAIDTRRAVIAPAIARSRQQLVAKVAAIRGERPVLCFIIGSAAEDALSAWLADRHLAAVPLGFQEPDEMADGLASGKCAAMAIDAADRAADDRVIAALATLPIDAVAAPDSTAAYAAALGTTAIDPHRPHP